MDDFEDESVDLLPLGVQAALGWLERHPGRDACDAATAAIMNAEIQPGRLGGEFDDLGRSRWPEFLQAVKDALT